MKYLIVLAASAMLFLGIRGKSISQNFWQKWLFNREKDVDEKKKEFNIDLIVWAILTLAIFIFVIFFGKI